MKVSAKCPKYEWNVSRISTTDNANAKRAQVYLEGSQNQVEHQAHLCLQLLRDEGEHDEVDPEQRDQKQSRLRQSPVTEEQEVIGLESLVEA